MKFTISCATFARLASVAAFIEPDVDEEIRRYLSCVRIENRNRQAYAIATNLKVASIEYLGPTTEQDSAVHVMLNERLVQQAVSETPFNSIMEVVSIPEIAVASVSTMLGYAHQGNVGVFPDKSPLDVWRQWAAPPAPASKGAMFWTVDHIETLVKASPSGKVVFPSFINVDQPVVLRDALNPNWVGLFLGKPSPLEPAVVPATLPAWWA